MRARDFACTLFLLTGCTTVTIVPTQVHTPDGLAMWAVLTDQAGHDHLLFCDAHGIGEKDPQKPIVCYDLTPRPGTSIGPIATPLRWDGL